MDHLELKPGKTKKTNPKELLAELEKCLLQESRQKLDASGYLVKTNPEKYRLFVEDGKTVLQERFCVSVNLQIAGRKNEETAEYRWKTIK